MTGSVHAAIGAAIGRYVRIKPLAFALGVLSHGVGDVIPHHDVGTWEAPVLLGTMAAIVKKYGVDSPEFWGALGAICPDFEHIPAELRRDPNRFELNTSKLFPTHNGQIEHAGWPFDERLGSAAQIALWAAGLWLAGVWATRKS